MNISHRRSHIHWSLLFVSCRFRPIIAVIIVECRPTTPQLQLSSFTYPIVALSWSHKEKARRRALAVIHCGDADRRGQVQCHSCTQHEQTREQPFRTFLFEFKKFSIEFKLKIVKNGIVHQMGIFTFHLRVVRSDASPNCVGCWSNRC